MINKNQGALLFATYDYVVARNIHARTARVALSRTIQESASRELDAVAPYARVRDRVAGEPACSPDGFALTNEGSLPDGSQQHHWLLPSAVALQRAEHNLEKAALAAGESDLRDAASALLAELHEPWRGYRPDIRAEVEQAETRCVRHEEVFEKLQQALANALEN